MKHILLPHDGGRRLSFYLAMEEHVAQRFPREECFFMWQVRPSVIFGRNQLIEAEVGVDYCRRNQIEMYRRKSGGGCVYADMGNVMFSYVASAPTMAESVQRYTQAVVDALRSLGIEAEASGRNDVLVGGRKVSGAAFYRLGNHNIVHATMLYDTQMDHMLGAITPSAAKLSSKGVKSVRQRIALLKDFTPLSLDAFKTQMLAQLCDGELLLTGQDVESIEEIEREYLSPEFIYGHNPRCSLTRRQRIDGVGEVEARVELRGGTIRNLLLLGDYFLLSDLGEGIVRPLIGRPFSRESLTEALPEDLGHVVHGLTRRQLADLLFGD